jgi:hypothetical protein
VQLTESPGETDTKGGGKTIKEPRRKKVRNERKKKKEIRKKYR